MTVHEDAAAALDSPLHEAQTIFERSVARRSSRLACRRSTCRSPTRRADPAGRCARGAAAAAGGRRARPGAPLRAPLAAQLLDRHAVLPARLVHHEVQPEGATRRSRAAGLRARCTRCRRTTAAQGALRAAVRACRATWRRSSGLPTRRCSRPPAPRASCSGC